MARRFHLGVDFGDPALLIDEVGDAVDALELAAHEFLGSPNAVSLEHIPALVAQQGVGESVFLGEFALFGRRVRADAHDADAPRLVLRVDEDRVPREDVPIEDREIGPQAGGQRSDVSLLTGRIRCPDRKAVQGCVTVETLIGLPLADEKVKFVSWGVVCAPGTEFSGVSLTLLRVIVTVAAP